MKTELNFGFTLLELIVTVAVVGILAALTLPNMRPFILNARIASQTSDFLADLNFARSEASKRGAAITLCPSSTSSTSTPSCDAGGTQWEKGWIAFADTNGDGAVSSNETVVRAHAALEGGNTLRSNQTWSQFSYRADGSVLPAPASGTRIIFSLCDERKAANARGVTIEGTGRATSVNSNSFSSLTCP